MTAFQTEVNADLPILWWEMSATSGSFPDASSSGRPGAVTGTITRSQPGSWGTDAISMAGAGSVSFSDSFLPNINTPWALTVAFKTSTAANQQLAQYGNVKIYLTAAGKLTFYLSGVLKSTSTLSFNDGAWHMLTLSREASFFRCYVDGVSASSSFPTASQSVPVRVGVGSVSSPLGGYAQFTGSIDEVVVNFGSLTSARAAAYWSARIAAATSTLDVVASGLVVVVTETTSDVITSGFVFDEFVVELAEDTHWWAGDPLFETTGTGEFSDWFGGRSPVIPDPVNQKQVVGSGYIPHDCLADAVLVGVGAQDCAADALLVSSGAIVQADGYVATSSGGRAFPRVPTTRAFPRIPSERAFPDLP